MKTDIHPKWYREARIVCACGNTFTVGSTKEELRVEICSRCHPFFTGELRYADTEGKVEKFIKKREEAARKAPLLKKKKGKQPPAEDIQPKTLKEMLMGL